MLEHGVAYHGQANLLIAPCVSPWGCERILCWIALTLDLDGSGLFNCSPFLLE